MIGVGLLLAGALTLAELQGLDGAERAKALLPPAVAAKVVGGTISRTDQFGRGWVAKYWEAPRATGPSSCQRTLHAVRILATDETLGAKTQMRVERQDSYEQITTTMDVVASPESCAANRTYVAVRPGDMPAGQVLLARLAEAVRRADGQGPLPFALTCDDVAKTEVCADPRRALAGLPLESMLAIDPNGALFTISGDAPTVLIGRSRADPASWIVRLRGTGTTPERVELVHAEMTFGGT